MELILHPDEVGASYHSHPWHRKIADFSLPEREIHTLRNARVTKSEFIGAESGMGGIYDHNGERMAIGQHLRRNKDFTLDNPDTLCPVQSSAVTTLPGRYLYLGWYFNHYGHFLLESLARCWALTEPATDQCKKYLFHFHARNGFTVKKYLEMLGLLGISGEQVVFITEDLLVEELIVPSQQAVLSRKIADCMLKLYRQLGGKADQMRLRKDYPARIYVSRRLLPGRARKAVNEWIPETGFAANGYEIIHPQFLSIPEQINYFAHAESIAGLDGSALHTVLFANNRPEMRLLCARNRLADAITQTELNRHVCRSTTLYLHHRPEPTCLRRGTSPFILGESDIRDFIPACTGISRAEKAADLYHLLRELALSLIDAARQCHVTEVAAELDLDETASEALAILFLAFSGETGKAAGKAEDLAKERQHDELSARTLARVLEQHGETSRAIALYSSLVREHDNDTSLFAALARNLDKAGYQGEALKAWQSARDRDPSDPHLPFQIAGLLLKTGEFEQAKREICSCLRINPYQPAYFVRYAQILAKREDFSEAARMLEKAITLAPHQEHLYSQLTWFLMQAGEDGAAEKAAHTALSMNSDNPVTHAHLSRLMARQNQTEEAIRYIDTAISLNPENPFYHEHLGELLLHAGKTEEAIRHLHRSRELGSQSPRLMSLLKEASRQ